MILVVDTYGTHTYLHGDNLFSGVFAAVFLLSRGLLVQSCSRELPAPFCWKNCCPTFYCCWDWTKCFREAENAVAKKNQPLD